MAIDYPAPGRARARQRQAGRPVPHAARVQATAAASARSRRRSTPPVPATPSRSPTAPTTRASSVRGSGKRYVKIIGDVAHPEKVVLEGRGLKGAKAQNGILVNGANEVTIRGLTAHALQGQRLLRRQRRRLHARQPARDGHRRLRHLRLQHQGRHDARLRGRVEQRRRPTTSGRRRSRRGRSARS